MLEFSEAVVQAAVQSTSGIPDDKPSRSIVRVDVQLVENQLSRATTRSHSFDSDEPEIRGGTDTAPSPLEYFLASLGFCQQVMIARNAAKNELALARANVRIRGYFDPRGGHFDGIDNVGFEEIRVAVDIASDEDDDTILQLMEAVDRECYVFNTLRRAVEISQTVTHNGVTILE